MGLGLIGKLPAEVRRQIWRDILLDGTVSLQVMDNNYEHTILQLREVTADFSTGRVPSLRHPLLQTCHDIYDELYHNYWETIAIKFTRPTQLVQFIRLYPIILRRRLYLVIDLYTEHFDGVDAGLFANWDWSFPHPHFPEAEMSVTLWFRYLERLPNSIKTILRLTHCWRDFERLKGLAALSCVSARHLLFHCIETIELYGYHCQVHRRWVQRMTIRAICNQHLPPIPDKRALANLQLRGCTGFVFGNDSSWPSLDRIRCDGGVQM